MQSMQQQMASTIFFASSQLFQAWKPSRQDYEQGVAPPSSPTMASAGGGTGGTDNNNLPPMIKAGTIMFAVLDTAVNSDEPGPILATMVSGKYKGAKLIGRLTNLEPKRKKSCWNLPI